MKGVHTRTKSFYILPRHHTYMNFAVYIHFRERNQVQDIASQKTLQNIRKFQVSLKQRQSVYYLSMDFITNTKLSLWNNFNPMHRLSEIMKLQERYINIHDQLLKLQVFFCTKQQHGKCWHYAALRYFNDVYNR